MTTPATMAVTRPAAAVAPEATPKASARGRATAATVTPRQYIPLKLVNVVASKLLPPKLKQTPSEDVLPHSRFLTSAVMVIEHTSTILSHFCLPLGDAASYARAPS